MHFDATLQLAYKGPIDETKENNRSNEEVNENRRQLEGKLY